MSRNNKVFGNRGEAIAGLYLTRNGFCVLQYNYRQAWGEIDIVAQKKDLTVFVEVKTRIIKAASDLKERPDVSITPKKIYKIRLTANSYIRHMKLDPGANYRFDAISIVIHREKVFLRHIPHAF